MNETAVSERKILTEADVKTPKKDPPAPRTPQERHQGFHRRIKRLGLDPNSRVVNAEASKKSRAQRIDDLDECVGKQFKRKEFATRLMHRFPDFASRTSSSVECRKLDGKLLFSGDWRAAHLLVVAAEMLDVTIDDSEIARALDEADGKVQPVPKSPPAPAMPALPGDGRRTFARRFERPFRRSA